ncbi:WD40/YVTN/BNR-like repeat-containing protein [Paraburkholderia bannensis]|uniref:WD40/YVTN/BNR-like repeat-containing protein n=1 Tax=Paraburkholderia bannensis TaxID=765414 RepID=UPI002AC340CD|nr:YCF48-related protein [Paraburkholderia bannensis]
MKDRMRFALIQALVSLAASSVAVAAPSAFNDPLATAAVAVPQGALLQQPVIALARVGGGAKVRLVAAGLRGLILVSDDGGTAWRQAHVPVQSDLVSLFFTPSGQGWAVGHDGVILHSADRGESWTAQFDGRVAQRTLLPYYQTRIDHGEKQLAPFAEQVALNTKDGPTLPFLAVHFDDDRNGYAIGSFGMLVATDDGGKTWRPWLDHIDNPNFLNLNDIREIAGDLYIAGEQGGVYRLDRAAQRFVAISPPYKGSFFRIAGNERFLLAVGLNGTAYRSTDRGANWSLVETGAKSSLTSAAFSADGKTLLLTAEGGQLFYSVDDALTFHAVRAARPMLFADVVADGGNDDFVLAGYQGIGRQRLKNDSNDRMVLPK